MRSRSVIRIVILALVIVGLAAPPAPVAGADPPAAVATSASHPVLAVSAGSWHSCAITTDGTIACWGQDGSGQSSPAAGTFTAVESGGYHTCGIRTDGTLACWRDSWYGQASPPAGRFIAVSAGEGHACAIAADGTLACWGDNESGQASPPAGTFTAVSAGGGHTCAIAADGTLACWGANDSDQTTPPAGTFIAVSAGGDHTCALRTDGTLACWGDNEYFEATPPAGTFTAVDAGYHHTCGIRTDGTLTCWGENDFGQPTPPTGTFTAVSAGGRHACAIRVDMTVACWGDDQYGQVTPRPTAAIRTLATWLATTAVPLTWSGRPAFAAVTSYDVRYRRATWNDRFGSWTAWLSATTANTATFTASPGNTYCFSTRARDVDGVASDWSPETCTAIPLDDRSLIRSGTWTAGTGTAYYRSTYLRSSTSGARLTRSGVTAKRIAIVATTCPTCGTLKVSWGLTLLKTVSLHSDTTVNKKLLNAASFSAVRTGTLTIEVVSRGKKVLIDGVAILGVSPSAPAGTGGPRALTATGAGPIPGTPPSRAGNWPQPGYGPAHTGFNLAEHVISATNVAGLGLAWMGQTGGAIGSPPVVADGVVYVGSGDGRLYAFAVGCRTGGGACTPRWTGQTGGEITSSPAVADGVVYIGSGDGTLHAFAVGCNTGGGPCTPLWTGQTGGPVSSPAVADGVVYVASADNHLYAFAAGCNSGGGTCTPLWTADVGWPSPPAVADGVVYVGSGDLLAFAVGCAKGGGTCSPVWTGQTGGWIGYSPAVADGVVYATSSDNHLYAFAAGCNSGGGPCTPLWSGTTGGDNDYWNWISSSPAVAGGVVLVGAGYRYVEYGDDIDVFPWEVVTGYVFAFAVGCSAAGGACAPHWTAATEGEPQASFAVANGVVYLTSVSSKDDNVDPSTDVTLGAWALGGPSFGDDSPLWTAKPVGDILSAPVISNGVVYVGSNDGRLYAFDLTHGDRTGPVITSGPRVSGAVPSVLRDEPTLISWRASDGAGSGIISYDLQQQKDGGTWRAIGTPTAEQATRALVLGHTYRYRVRAHDRAGNVGAWATSAAVTPTLVESTSPLVAYPRGAWHTQRVAGPSGGATRWSTSTGARARFTFTGRAVAWVTATGPTRGTVKVYVDGAYRSTVELQATGVSWRQVRFSASWSSRGSHTLELRSALAGSRVDVDAFVVYR